MGCSMPHSLSGCNFGRGSCKGASQRKAASCPEQMPSRLTMQSSCLLNKVSTDKLFAYTSSAGQTLSSSLCNHPARVLQFDPMLQYALRGDSAVVMYWNVYKF